jgi:hypothetical protein
VFPFLLKKRLPDCSALGWTPALPGASLRKPDSEKIASAEIANHVFDLTDATILNVLPAHPAQHDSAQKPETKDRR